MAQAGADERAPRDAWDTLEDRLTEILCLWLPGLVVALAVLVIAWTLMVGRMPGWVPT